MLCAAIISSQSEEQCDTLPMEDLKLGSIRGLKDLT